MEDSLLPPLGGDRERWTDADDSRLRDALATIDAAGLRPDDKAIGAALGWSPWTIRKRRRALGMALRVRRDPEPDLELRIREFAAQGMDAGDIASAIGPDADGRHYAPRSIQERAWQLGIQLAGGTVAPIPTLAQLAARLRVAGFELAGNGRWTCGEQVVVLPPPGSRVTRVLAGMVRRACGPEIISTETLARPQAPR